MRAHAWMRLAQHVFTALAILTLGYCIAVFVDARFYQASRERTFDQSLRLRPLPSPGRPPVVGSREGDLVGKLEIPRLGVTVMVVQGVEQRDLDRAVGHIPGTALPGEPGNVGIAGHRDTFFRALHSIHRNDIITLRTFWGTYRYRVVSTRIVRPDDVGVLYPTRRDTLTLVTCFPFHYVGSAPKRFIVRAARSPHA